MTTAKTRAKNSFIFAAAVLLPSHTFAAGAVYKCPGSSGEVAYQDTPCLAGRKVDIVNDAPTITDQVKAERGLQQLREDSRAIDARLARESHERQRARDADDRERRHQELMERITAPPVPEPHVVYVPYYSAPYAPHYRPHRRDPPPAALPPTPPPPPVKKKK